MEQQNTPLLAVSHLQKRFGETPVLDDVSFDLRRGETAVILGPSGCGKSTLLRCINALEPIQGGRDQAGRPGHRPLSRRSPGPPPAGGNGLSEL